MRHSFNGNYPITNDFGVYDPVAYANYPGKRHPGTDYGVPNKTQLVAGISGFLQVYDRSPSLTTGRGKEVVIINGNTTRKACHMSQITVSTGDWIKEGDQIGLSGNTGYSSGPHLHDELIIDGVYQDLEKHLNEEEDVKPQRNQIILAYKLAFGPENPPTEDQIQRQLGQPDLSKVLISIEGDSAKAWQKAKDSNQALSKLDQVKKIINS